MRETAILTFLWLLSLPVFSQQKKPFGYALVPDMIADASIEKIGDTFYCYATTDGYGRGLETSGPPVVWKSKDFVHWSFEGTYFPSAENEKYWAPSKAVQRGDKWYIYPTVNGYMHVGVADSPDGPFRLVGGVDKFEKPYTPTGTLRQGDDRGGIDAEVFIDDNGQAYMFWGGRHVAKLGEDMRTLSDVQAIETRKKEYSEGPIFFKRRGIYYYLYTIGGDESYEYYYQISRTSPLGPWETPVQDLICTTSVEKGVFGPGHGCVFNNGDDYYLAFLEFGRNSTNRQTYVNRLEFNDDSTIRQVDVSLDGVGALCPADDHQELKPVAVTASSTREPHAIRYQNDRRCQRTEQFDADFAFDGANGSRWMTADSDSACWLMIDLGKSTLICRSEIAFVRPTAGHAYRLEGSQDGKKWKSCGGHSDIQKRSPHIDHINQKYRYLRLNITKGVRGVWEWRILGGLTRTWGQWNTWGEQPDGTYLNPVIPADYSDIDCIRVGDEYYAISSTMQFSPGMTILHSHDLVNWEIAGNAVSDLTQISPSLGWQQMDRYGRGIWAGTLRYHRSVEDRLQGKNGRFYLFFSTPDEGFFMTTAPQASGPWEPLTPLLQESGWDDCSALWDEQGHGWFVGTCFREGYKTYRFRMADDGRSIDRSTATLINEGNGREASKLLYHDGYYYLIFSEHRDGIGRYVMAKRDRKITGKFSEERQLLLPCREAHEPNQGGIIEVNPQTYSEGREHRGREKRETKWYFLTHHGDGDWSGRIVSLLPVEWRDGWPMIGQPSDRKPGSMVWQAPMPIEKNNKKGKVYSETIGDACSEGLKDSEKVSLQRSDDFDNEVLGPQWQWNYQPRQDYFSLTERPGWLRLKAFEPLEPDKLLKAGNTLTQRSFRAPHNEVTIKIDINHLADGQHAGLCHFAEHNASLGVVKADVTTYLELRDDDNAKLGPVVSADHLWIRSTWGTDGLSHFSYSLDGIHFTPFGDYRLSWGYYRGDRIGIYCYGRENGYIDVDYLHYTLY